MYSEFEKLMEQRKVLLQKIEDLNKYTTRLKKTKSLSKATPIYNELDKKFHVLQYEIEQQDIKLDQIIKFVPDEEKRITSNISKITTDIESYPTNIESYSKEIKKQNEPLKNLKVQNDVLEKELEKTKEQHQKKLQLIEKIQKDNADDLAEAKVLIKKMGSASILDYFDFETDFDELISGIYARMYVKVDKPDVDAGRSKYLAQAKSCIQRTQNLNNNFIEKKKLEQKKDIELRKRNIELRKHNIEINQDSISTCKKQISELQLKRRHNGKKRTKFRIDLDNITMLKKQLNDINVNEFKQEPTEKLLLIAKTAGEIMKERKKERKKEVSKRTGFWGKFFNPSRAASKRNHSDSTRYTPERIDAVQQEVLEERQRQQQQSPSSPLPRPHE